MSPIRFRAKLHRPAELAARHKRIRSKRQREAATIREIASAAGSSLEIEEILYLSLDRLLPLMDLQAGWVHLLDQTAFDLRLAAVRGIPFRAIEGAARLHVGEGFPGLVAETGEPVVGANFQTDDHLDWPRGVRECRSFAAVPLKAGNRVVGVMSLISYHERPFTKHDLDVVLAAGRSMGVAVEHARLWRLGVRRTRELEALHAVSKAIISTVGVPRLMQLASEALCSVLGLHRAIAFLLDEEHEVLRPVAGVHVELPALQEPLSLDRWHVARRAIESRRAIFDPDPVASGLFSIDEAARGRVVGVLVVPIVSGDRPLGLFGGDWGGKRLRPRAEDLAMAESLTNQVAAAVENARLQEHARVLAVFGERNRLAREIHDTIVQSLTAISLQLEAARGLLPEAPDRASRNVERALGLARASLEEARRSVLDLQPGPLQRLSLPDALRALIEEIATDTGWRVEFDAAGYRGHAPQHYEAGLYRIAQEALVNAKKHAAADWVRLVLSKSDTDLTLSVQDNGKGFDTGDPELEPGHDGGFGLISVQERARLLGGEAQFVSAPGRGTIVRVRIPLNASALSIAPRRALEER